MKFPGRAISYSPCPHNFKESLGTLPGEERVFDQVIGQMFPNSDEFELLGEEILKSNFNYC